MGKLITRLFSHISNAICYPIHLHINQHQIQLDQQHLRDSFQLLLALPFNQYEPYGKQLNSLQPLEFIKSVTHASNSFLIIHCQFT